MKYASIPWARTVPTTLVSKNNGRPNLFAWFVESLHLSRRREARRFLRTHAYLFDGSADAGLEKSKGGDDMADAEKRCPVRRASNGSGMSENSRLASLACAFPLFNVFIVIAVFRALPDAPRVQSAEVIISQGD